MKNLLQALTLSILFGLTSICHAQTKLTGTIIGHSGSWGNNPATTISAAFDGDLCDEDFANAILFNLEIDKGTLTPKFRHDVTDYHVYFQNPESSVNISASATDDSFNITGTGEFVINNSGDAATVEVSGTGLNSSSYNITFHFLEDTTRTRVIVTTDGEADDQSSMVRFLLSSNEFEVEAIVNSSSQFHWLGATGWNSLHPVEWIDEYVGYYEEDYHNLVLHDINYPSPDYLRSVWKVGSINSVGEDDIRTEGTQLIADVLLDETDSRPIWLQAWGGVNTISRALKIIQEDYPDKMAMVAAKMKLFLIWEQDGTYQDYIRPNWEHLNPLVIISDQFDCMAYIWNTVLPNSVKPYFGAPFVSNNIKNGHGVLTSHYVDNNGAFNAEGDTPSFLHAIPNGLRNMENPGYGGWGGRYVNVRNNVWMDPPPTTAYTHPDGQRSIHNSWSKMMESWTTTDQVVIRDDYFKPIWRWLPNVQNEFAARADWCIKDYEEANHYPIINLVDTPIEISATAGSQVTLDASNSTDPDGDNLSFIWWHHTEAGTYQSSTISNSYAMVRTLTIPNDAQVGDTIHMICQVSDLGVPSLTKYQRIIITVTNELSTGYEDFNNGNKLYPNPVKDNLNIELNDDFSSGSKLSLYDINGRKLLSRKVSGKNHTLAMDQFSSGAYILEVSNDF